ncbi:MAG TPA: group I intron-associated PD-(D/E)XK endonuclease [Gemmatimonadaceae bacterium]
MGSSPTPVTSSLTSGRGRRANCALGEASEVAVFTALRRRGYAVLVAPFAASLPYDCVIDDGRHLLRVQVKTGYVDRHRAIRWATRSTGGSQRTRTYRGRADLFAVYVPEIERTFLVPVEECGRREASIRLSPARNGQKHGVRHAEQYEI